MKSEISLKAKEIFDKYIEKNEDIFNLKDHIVELEKLVEKLKKKFPELDKEILLLAVYFHDIGYYPLNPNEDHAITGERIARKFLEKEKYYKEKMEKVLHAIRSHRCKDVLPETLEAKAFAFMDSASHLTDKMYVEMVKQGKGKKALEKLERDYRDLSIFPEIKKEMEPLYLSWKSLISNLTKFEESKL
jgi:putative nucleotidyltransferase with HDIG domain